MRIKGQLLINAMQGLQLMPVGAYEKTVWVDGSPTEDKELQVICYVYEPEMMEPQEVRIILENTPGNIEKIKDSIGQLIGTIENLEGLIPGECTTFSGKLQTEYAKIVAKGIKTK
jgi:hypothetical protein